MSRKDEEMELAFFWANNHRYSQPDHKYQSCLCYGKGLFNQTSFSTLVDYAESSMSYITGLTYIKRKPLTSTFILFRSHKVPPMLHWNS